MSARQVPISTVLSVSEFFGPSNSYSVPQYQRGYAWGPNELDDFTDDLLGFYASTEPYYMLGQVIVTPANDFYTWSLVDGQQRSTSLYLLLLAGYHQVLGLATNAQQNFRISSVFNSLAFVSSTTGNFTPKIKVAGDGDDFVNELLEGRKNEEPKSENQERIQYAFDFLSEFLTREFIDSAEILKFLERVLSGVWLTRLEMVNQHQALRVFERINHRGLKLDSADLMKNLLFQEVEEEEFESISSNWESSTGHLYKSKNSRARNMEFLMKALLSIKTGQSIPNSRVFDEWSEILKSEQNALTFASNLPFEAEKLSRIASGLTPSIAQDGSKISVGTDYFNMVQHYQLLLAAGHLDKDTYIRVANLVENRAVLSLLAKEKSNDFERLLPAWAKSISQIKSGASSTDVYLASRNALENLDELVLQAGIYFDKWSYGSQSHKKKIRYILARVARKVEESANSIGILSSAPLDSFLKASSGKYIGFDIDHVLPSATKNKRVELGGDDFSFLDTIGNLVLLHPSDNRAAGDAEPIDKAKDYASSNLLINKVLCSKQDLGLLNTRLEKVVNELHKVCLPNLSNWHVDQVKARANLYWEIFSDDILSSLSIGRP